MRNARKKKRSKPTKTKSLRAHLKRRFLERFGVEINRIDEIQMLNQIQNKEAEFIEKQSIRVSVFDVKLNEVKYRVVYDKNRKHLVTVLPYYEKEGEMISFLC